MADDPKSGGIPPHTHTELQQRLAAVEAAIEAHWPAPAPASETPLTNMVPSS